METFQKALKCYRLDNLTEAEDTCRQILLSEPENADVLHLLGMILFNKADYESAKDFLEKAIKIKPENHVFHYSLGEAYRGLYLLADAIECYEKAIILCPDFLEAFNNLGIVFHELGLLGRAIETYKHALSIAPDCINTLMNLGNAFVESKSYDEARTCFDRVITQDPDFMDVYVGFYDTFQNKGKFREELACYSKNLRIGPNSSLILDNLGTVLQELGHLEEASDSFHLAIELNPCFAEGYNNLGIVQNSLECYDEAIESFKKALELKHDFVEARNNLGISCYYLGLFEEAKSHFEATIRQKDNYAKGYANLGLVLAEEGSFKSALSCYKKAIFLTSHVGLKTLLATLVPVIPQSVEEIQFTRKRLEKKIETLLNEELILDDPVQQIGKVNFYLAYQGMGDKVIQTKLAEFYEKICPNICFVAPHCHRHQTSNQGARIRIGFVSEYLRNHTIGKYVRGIIAHLDRDLFEVHTLFFSRKKDETVEFIVKHSDTVRILSRSLPIAHRQISAMELDILFYSDIGMEPFTYFLAFSRLAPVQCVFYGHPITTGIPNVDYFISHEDCEVEGCDGHYSERLVQLSEKAAYAYFYRPEVSEFIKTRADFLYCRVCPSLFVLPIIIQGSS